MCSFRREESEKSACLCENGLEVKGKSERTSLKEKFNSRGKTERSSTADILMCGIVAFREIGGEKQRKGIVWSRRDTSAALACLPACVLISLHCRRRRCRRRGRNLFLCRADGSVPAQRATLLMVIHSPVQGLPTANLANLLIHSTRLQTLIRHPAQLSTMSTE